MTRIEVPNSTRGARGASRGKRFVVLLLLTMIAGAGLWTWLTLAWAYSDGTRAGVLQKFSRRGWICRTHEGELAQYVVAGVSPQIWTFSVRDAAVAAQLDKVVGYRVQLHYTEHPGVPTSCFADTRYFVDRVTVTEALPSAAPPSPAPSSPAPPSPVPSNAAPSGTEAPKP